MPHDFLEVILQGLHLQILTDNYATKLIRVIIIMIIVNVSIPTSGLIKLWCVCWILSTCSLLFKVIENNMTHTHLKNWVHFHINPHKKDPQTLYSLDQASSLSPVCFLFWKKFKWTHFPCHHSLFIPVQMGEWLWIDPAWRSKLFSPLQGLKCQYDSAIHLNATSFIAFHGTGMKPSSDLIIPKAIYGYTAMCSLGPRQ